MEFTLNTDAEQMKKRLWHQLTLEEFFALALALGMVGLFLFEKPNLSFLGIDFKVGLEAAYGRLHYQNLYYYYGYWILPIFAILSKLPFDVAYVIWSILNIIGVFFSSRVFGGKAIIAIISYQMFYTLIYGNITGLIIGGLGLCWYGIINKKWHIAGLGIALASTKYQIGLSVGLLLVLTADIKWIDRLRLFIVPIIIWTLSLLIYPNWLLQELNTITNHPPDTSGSISLWRWIGPWAILLLLPPLLLRLKPHQRFLALVAAIGLAAPYYQQTDLLFLLVLPIGWIGLLSNIGYLMEFYGWIVLQLLFFFPLTIYSLIILPEFNKLISIFKKFNVKTD